MHSQAKTEHGLGNATCGCQPGDFTRLRYFFGQHLGVVDFNDQLAYDIGKHRFSNRHLHGSGVLCGLRAERMVFPQGVDPNTPTSLLRVTRGAAIDACGREVLVPVDQCIDVNGWLARHRERPDVQAWNADHPATVWVGLRYRECPSGPAPAPRDLCGCDSGGCEYSRVLEGFELALLTATEIAEWKDTTYPSSNELINALAEPDLSVADFSSTAFHNRLTALVSTDCPTSCCDDWLLLARISLTVDAVPPQQVIDISSIELQIPERRTLLSTSALQVLVESLVEATVGTGRLAKGPRISGPIQFSAMVADSGQLFLDVQLAETGTPPVPAPLLQSTFDQKFVKVSRFDQDSKTWQLLGTTSTYQPERFSIVIESGLTEGSYRLAIAAPLETPVIDEKLRPLQPDRFATDFRLVMGADGVLHLDSSPTNE